MDKRPDAHPSGGRVNPASRGALRSGAPLPLVGREEEMSRLGAALDLAAEGRGGTIFLTGEPGIGKTRLAREALALAKDRGFTTLEGRAYSIEVGLAYAPFLDAFGQILRGLHPVHLAALVDGLPDLGRLFGGLALPIPFFSEGLGDPTLEKTRLFEAVSRLLERLAGEKPVALFFDDVHQSDPSTLELLHYLARSLPDRRTLLLATYCTLDSPHRLRAMVVSLERDGLAEDIVVPRLRRDAVDELIRGILQGEVPNELLTVLDARAGGTPLFVVGLVRTLLESGHLTRSFSEDNNWILDAKGATALPSGVRHLILERLERLKPPDRRVLDLIAVMGDATSHTILRAACGLKEGTLLGALRHLRGAGLVVEGMAGTDVTYSMTHPLIQEVAYAELPEMERRRAHVAAIKALESLSEERPDALVHLARHYRSAGPEASSDLALAMLVAAGERALSVYANEEAAQYFEAALAIVRKGRQAEGGEDSSSNPSTLNLQPSTLSIVLERLGEAWERIGRRGAAVAIWNEALIELERAYDALAASRLHRRLASADYYRGHFDMANSHLQAGLAALAGHEPCQELVDLRSLRFHHLGRLGDGVGMAEEATELLFLAERLASPRVEADANLSAAMVNLKHGDIVLARERALHALMVGEQSQDLMICCTAHSVLTVIGMFVGDHHLIRDHAERGRAVARRLGSPNHEILLGLRLLYARFLSGDWDEALRCGMETIALARRVGHPRDLAYSLVEWAMILVSRGDLSEAEACVSEAKAVFGGEALVERYMFALIDIAETALALERGQTELALRIARGFIPSSESTADLTGFAPPHLPMGLMLLAEAQVATGEPENALETAQRLFDLASAETPYLTALASWAEGLARQALGQDEPAVYCLARACETFTTLAIPFMAAKALLVLAEIGGQVTEVGGRSPVLQPLSHERAALQSLAIFECLGAQRYAERARQLLRSLGIGLVATQRTRLGGFSVSERELEIARLIAEGLTMAEIANRLNIGSRTVGSHLHRIYARLGITSRTALASLIIRAGLLSPSNEVKS